jgi:hypothetical protein
MDSLDTLDSFLVQLSNDIVNAFFGLAEDYSPRLTSICLQLGQKLNESDIFFFSCDTENLLLDLGVCSCLLLLANLDIDRLFNIADIFFGKRLDFLRPCRTKHESLSVRSHMTHDSLKLRLKAQVLQFKQRTSFVKSRN